MTLVQPIAELGPAVGRIEIMLSDDAREYPLADNSERESIMIVGLFHRPSDESRRIMDGCIVIQPGEPLLQVRSITINEKR